MPSDRDQLLEMGFDPEKVGIAVKKTGGRKAGPDSLDIWTANALLQWPTRLTG